MAFPLSKREWTEIQREIWKNVETYTNLIMKGDVEGFLDYFHKDYSGWNYCELMPVNKTDVKNELWRLPKRKIVSYNITPVAINIFNDAAIVHYYYSAAYKNTDGKEKAKKGRNTDILLKQKDKWILIGDHVGLLERKKPTNLKVRR
jgi:ketosteroid isomerase-like protein